MNEKRQWKLTSMQTKTHVAQQVYAADLGKVVTIQPATRSLEQNALLHALLTDIARQAKYLGKTRSVDVWRGLFVSGWEIATGKPSEIVPGLEGEFLNVRRSTTQMGVKDLSSLCEYIQAWAANEGVRFSAPEWEGI